MNRRRRQAALRHARWQGKNGERTQSALAVYEVEEGRVRRVWYYPVQP